MRSAPSAWPSPPYLTELVASSCRMSATLVTTRPASISALSPDIAIGSRRSPRQGSSRRFSRSEEHTSELQSLMRSSYAVFCLKKKNHHIADGVNNSIEIGNAQFRYPHAK